jgi:hypothetical protein
MDRSGSHIQLNGSARSAVEANLPIDLILQVAVGSDALFQKSPPGQSSNIWLSYRGQTESKK